MKTNFEGGSKKYMSPHPAYTADDMPARKLEKLVKGALKMGAGIEPIAIAKLLFEIASRGEKVPLYLPMGVNALGLIKKKLEGRLEALEACRELAKVD